MIAIPPLHWQQFRMLSVKKFAALLRALATRVDMKRLQKAHSGPKKPRPKHEGPTKASHISTAKLLRERKVNAATP